jgi:hypothetical protein
MRCRCEKALVFCGTIQQVLEELRSRCQRQRTWEIEILLSEELHPNRAMEDDVSTNVDAVEKEGKTRT